MSDLAEKLLQPDAQPSLTIGGSDGSLSSLAAASGDGASFQKTEANRQSHALLIDLILESVFKLVRPNDLKACRGVCQKWNVLSIPFMRSSFVVSIYGDQNEEEQELGEDRHFGDFVETFRSNLFGIPFSKFRLAAFSMTEGVGKEFLELCAETAKEIDLESLDIYEVENVSEILRSSTNLEFIGIPRYITSRSGGVVKLFPSSLPRLSSLKKVTTLYQSTASRNKFCPTLFDELFMAAENICDITVKDRRLAGSAGTIGHVLNIIENRGLEPSIESLDLHNGCQEHFDLLRTMSQKPQGLKLKKLIFWAFLIQDAVSDSTQFATIFKDSLEYLDLYETAFTSFAEFPRMPHLKFLKLSVSEDFNSIPMNLNDIFPILRTLALDFLADEVEVYDNFFSEFDCCPAITTLDVGWRLQIEIQTFDNILTVFTNLTKLELNAREDGAEILRKIWAQMTQLEELHFGGNLQDVENLDALFTGFQINTIKGMECLDIVSDLKEMTVELRRKTIQKLKRHFCRAPAIENLTKLRRLVLRISTESDWGINKTELTDLSGYLAFHSMMHLKNLCVSATCQFTDTCCEILTEEMELESWNFDTEIFGHSTIRQSKDWASAFN